MFSCVWLFVTPWTVAHQAPLSMGFSRQEHWSGLPCPSPGDLPDPRDWIWISHIAGSYFQSHQRSQIKKLLFRNVNDLQLKLVKLPFELRFWCPWADLYCQGESCHRPLFWVSIETKPSCTCDSQVSLETLLSEIMIPHIPFWTPLPSTSCLYCCCNRLLKFSKHCIHKFRLQSFLKIHSLLTVVTCSGAAVTKYHRLSSLYNQNLC